MKNAIATLHVTLDIPTDRVKSVAREIGRDPKNDDDYQLILDELEDRIARSPADWLEYEKSTEIEVDA